MRVKKPPATDFGLTTPEWNRLIAYYQSLPPPLPDPDDIAHRIHAHTITACYRRTHPLPADFCREAQRIALTQNALQKGSPQ